MWNLLFCSNSMHWYKRDEKRKINNFQWVSARTYFAIWADVKQSWRLLILRGVGLALPICLQPLKRLQGRGRKTWASQCFQNDPEFSKWFPIFWTVSKLFGFIQIAANFPDGFKIVRTFPDDCQFSGRFQKVRIFPDHCQFSGWFQNYLEVFRCKAGLTK